MKKSERIDKILVDKGFFPSREKAKRAIIAGEVKIGTRRILKPSELVVKEEADLIVVENSFVAVSRGYEKIAGVYDKFKLNFEGKLCCDLGASTGGFTQFMLDKGAKKVFSVDVGKGVLHYKLRTDSRVVVLEGVNARYLKIEDIGERVDFTTIDLSFISVLKVIEKTKEIVKGGGELLVLIKPQFEVGRKFLKKGIVRDKQLGLKVARDVADKIEKAGFCMENFAPSPIKGTKGNLEYFAYFVKTE